MRTILNLKVNKLVNNTVDIIMKTYDVVFSPNMLPKVFKLILSNRLHQEVDGTFR